MTRKLFRMKYEPCSGRCYAPSDVFRMSGLGAQVAEMTDLLKKIVRIHEPAQRAPGLGHDVREHGKNPDLVNFALQHSGLPAEQCAEIAASL